MGCTNCREENNLSSHKILKFVGMIIKGIIWHMPFLPVFPFLKWANLSLWWHRQYYDTKTSYEVRPQFKTKSYYIFSFWIFILIVVIRDTSYCLTHLGFSLNMAPMIIKAIVEALLSQEDKMKEAMSAYIDNIFVNNSVVSLSMSICYDSNSTAGIQSAWRKRWQY